MKTLDTNPIILVERHPMANGTVALLTFNRGPQRNPLDKQTIVALNVCLDDLIADTAVRAVVITGAPPAFSAGGDLRGYLDLYKDEPGFETFLIGIRDAFNKLETSRLLSIAAVNGVCVAGGFELVLSCDLVIMSRQARMGDAHLKFWQLPGGGGTQRLARAIGHGAAKRLLFMKDLLSAEECLRLGLASKIAEADSLIGEALALANDVCAAPDDTILTLKELLRTAFDQPISKGLDIEIARLVRYTSGSESSAYKGLERFFQREGR